MLTRFLTDLDAQIHLFEKSGRDTAAKLANWLDRNIRETSLLPADKRAFLLKAIEGLIETRGLSVAELDRHRHMLKTVLSSKIAAHRLNAETSTYQQLLDDDGFGVSMDCCIRFPAVYPADKLCTALFDWQKHFYSDVAAMNNEELEVAKYLDSRPEVLHWVRNLEGEHHTNHAFWLRRPHGRFFPDFVVELVGEKYLVVEYKGAHIEEGSEQQEKRRVGEMWAASNPDELAFVWAEKTTWQDKTADAIKRLCDK